MMVKEKLCFSNRKASKRFPAASLLREDDYEKESKNDYDSHFSQNEFFVLLVLLLICNFHA